MAAATTSTPAGSQLDREVDAANPVFCYPFLAPLQKLFSKPKRSMADRAADASPSNSTDAQPSAVEAMTTTTSTTAANLPVASRKIRVIFVLGGPGSGKGTQCTKLVAQHPMLHVSVGDLLRQEVAKKSPLGDAIAAAIREGAMVPMSTTLFLLRTAINTARAVGQDILLDGFPRTLDQAKAFENEFGQCAFLMHFDCPAEELSVRLLKRGETSGRDDDNAETIAKRLAAFERLTRPVVDYYTTHNKLYTVDGTGTVEEVAERADKLFAEALQRHSDAAVSLLQDKDDLGDLEEIAM